LLRVTCRFGWSENILRVPKKCLAPFLLRQIVTEEEFENYSKGEPTIVEKDYQKWCELDKN